MNKIFITVLAAGLLFTACKKESATTPHSNVSAEPVYGPGTGALHFVSTTVQYNSKLYIGCNYVGALYQWNDTVLSPFDSVNGDVDVLYVYNGNLIAGGNFTDIKGASYNHIAQWNGSAWSSLGSGMDNTVTAMATYNGNLVAGGSFQNAGGVAVNSIAEWNGSVWTPLGVIGNKFSIYALTVYNGELYAGGNFGILKWNGSQWDTLGAGVNGEVDALIVYDSAVYAGGYFTKAGGLGPSTVAKWNGTAWSIPGNGMQAYDVKAFTIYNGNLVVAGYASPYAYDGISIWNGTSWSFPQNSDITSSISASRGGQPIQWLSSLYVYKGKLIIGGVFQTVGGVSATNIAQWDGSNWSAL